VNGSANDSKSGTSVPSVLNTPIWVTTTNMESTVIADKAVTPAQLCVAQFAAACKAAGIS
jgi:D-xylose transport system substrate-binding protein